jgi:hypothetical protein
LRAIRIDLGERRCGETTHEQGDADDESNSIWEDGAREPGAQKRGAVSCFGGVHALDTERGRDPEVATAVVLRT